jgi:PglZ domain.
VNGKEIKSTSDRTTQLRYFKADGICIQYEDFSKMGKQEKRDLCKRSVVYIYHDTIDSMSHKNPKQIGTACEIAIRELKDLISSLHATCNVTNVILTADLGFLYNDMEFAEKDKHKITEETVELKTRYYISNDSSEASAPGFGISKFPVSKVSGMSGPSYVAVPNGSNRLYAAGGGYEFAHGGASLQELLIPVLYSHVQRVDKKTQG